MKSPNSEKPSEQFADVRRHLPFLAKREGLARMLEGMLCYPEVRRLFAESEGEPNVSAGVMRRFGMRLRVEGELGKIPRSGPLVVVCNHGHGGADALGLMALMGELRADFKALANRETALLAGMAPLVFPVSILGGDQAIENISSIRAMLKHVRGGGSLGVFPAGRVALWRGDRMQDPVWNAQVVKLLQRMDATIVPLWFFGNPPALINVLSRLSSFVRAALIPTGLAKMKGRELVARVGEPLTGKEMKAKGDEAGAWLRGKLEGLGELGY